MLTQVQDNVTASEYDDGVGPDSFRRAAFNWAVSTKRLVESSTGLTPNTKVPGAALADIEHARVLLGSLFIPVVSTAPAAFADKIHGLTAKTIQDSVSDLATRISTSLVVPGGVKPEPGSHRGADLSTPVWPKNGKMLWAGMDCPVCPSKAGQRCQKDEGVLIEKPHQPRKSISEQV